MLICFVCVCEKLENVSKEFVLSVIRRHFFRTGCRSLVWYRETSLTWWTWCVAKQGYVLCGLAEDRQRDHAGGLLRGHIRDVLCGRTRDFWGHPRVLLGGHRRDLLCAKTDLVNMYVRKMFGTRAFPPYLKNVWVCLFICFVFVCVRRKKQHGCTS